MEDGLEACRAGLGAFRDGLEAFRDGRENFAPPLALNPFWLGGAANRARTLSAIGVTAFSSMRASWGWKAAVPSSNCILSAQPVV